MKTKFVQDSAHLMNSTHSFINGEFVKSGSSYQNINPSTGEVIGDVSIASEFQVADAIGAAREAQPAWQALAPRERADFLETIAATILEYSDELSRIESEDTGKPLSQAVADVNVCARYFKFYSRTIEAFYADQIPLGPGYHAYTTHEPFGVVGYVLAWNYPMQLFARAVAPAIATGNTIVLKPADETPRTAVRIAELATQMGLPLGVINVLTGTGIETGSVLAASSDIDQIGFVGSAPVGKSIARSASENLIPAVLELGGKSPHLVFSDANLDEVVPAVVRGIIQNAGQTCSAGSRLLVQDAIYDQLLERVAKTLSEITIGPGDTDPDLGPLISEKQLDRVQNMVSSADGTILIGGRRAEHVGRGNYYLPTIIGEVDPNSEIAREEVFGPVLTAFKFTDANEAVELANSVDYGLIGAVWTRDINRALSVAQELKVGQVFVNNYGAGGGVELPFGGVKNSGYGREKGIAALYSMTQPKTTVIKIESKNN